MVDPLKRIKEIRSQKHYTQEYLAASLDMDRVSYANIESGKRRLTVDRMQKIAEILGVDVTVFFTDDTKNNDMTTQNPYMNEPIVNYRDSNNNELLKRIELLERLLNDKEKIIQLLETKK